MAKITIFKAPEHSDKDMKDYRSKLFRHRAGQWGKILLCTVVLLGVAFGVFVWQRNKTYLNYEITNTVERNDILNTQYAEYNGKILKYSRDGISCVTHKNEALWSQTYNMKTPVIDVCQKAVVVGNLQGNEVYVFNDMGLQTQITTLLPIQQVSISAQGVTALLLDDSDAAWIYLYDKEGNKLAESRCSLEETGQPLSISISSDGTKLAVSYLQIQSGEASSCVAFYNFGPVGGNFVDKIVASKVYEGILIPRVKYLGDSVCTAVAEDGILFYEGKEIPEEKRKITEEEEIQSIFFGEKEVGLAIKGGSKQKEEEGKDKEETESFLHEIHVYDTSGNSIMAQGTNLDYSHIKISGGNLMIYNENECEIYNKSGVLKYTGTFSSALSDIYKGSGFRKYLLLFSDRTEEIKLK